jgi:hypothetical protein
MKLSKIFVPFSIVKAEGPDAPDQHLVEGIASSEAVDADGEIISFDAIKASLGEYMKFANLREMHGMSAAGTVTKADADDDERVLAMRDRTPAQVLTYGLDPQADLWADEIVSEGLEGIVDLVKIGRMTYQRIITWILNKIMKTFQITVFVVLMFLLTGQVGVFLD